MKPTASLLYKGVQLPCGESGAQWLVELSCPTLVKIALAIVLDLSDSCGPLRDEAEKFRRLVAHVPRDMPLWLYRLSNYAPSSMDCQRVGDLQDGNLQLFKWLEDSRTRSKMAVRGSFLRPAIDSISERKVRENVSRVKVVVLTDGELLDTAVLDIPDGFDITGLTTSSTNSKCTHWRRVLPRFPIYDLSNLLLDDLFADVTTPFYGACDVSWCHREVTLTAMVVDLANAQIWQVERSPQMWNFADQKLMLLLKAAKPSSYSPTVTCRSMKSHESIEIQLTSMEPLDSSIVAEVSNLLTARKKTHAEKILDVSASDSQFDSILSQFLAARSLAKSRAS